jgi:hypothetical protein
VQVARASANKAHIQEAITTEELRFDLQNQREEAHFDIRDRIGQIEDAQKKPLSSHGLDSSIKVGKTGSPEYRVLTPVKRGSDTSQNRFHHMRM